MVRNSSPNKSEKLKKILKFLSYRARSEKEIRDRLTRYGLDQKEIETEIEKLKKWKLIDDNEFAQLYAESRARSQPRSNWLINLELKRKGVKPGEETLSDLELAKLALGKKKNLKSREQAVHFLQSRGFSWETIVKVLQDRYNDPNG